MPVYRETRPRAHARFIRISPTKVRRVIDLIKERDVTEAEAILDHLTGPTPQMVKKVLLSARANAEHNQKLDPEELYVARAFVDSDITLRRWRVAFRGRANRIRKRTCRITVVLDKREEGE